MDHLKNWRVWLSLSPLVPAAILPGQGALLSFLIVLLALGLVKPAREAVLQMLDKDWGQTLTLGIGGGLAIASLGWAVDSMLTHVFGLPLDLSSFDAVTGNLKNYLVLLAIGIVVGGVLEEMTFRGFVVGWGTALLGEGAKVWLVLLSATAFGLAHFYQGLGGAISTGLTGAMIGFLYLYANRKLLVPMLAHGTVNVIGVTAIYLGVAA